MGEALRTDRFAAPESMAAWVMRFGPASDAEALKLLRGRFPDSPLSLRVAALDYLMRRKPGFAGTRNPLPQRRIRPDQPTLARARKPLHLLCARIRH